MDLTQLQKQLKNQLYLKPVWGTHNEENGRTRKVLVNNWEEDSDQTQR